MRRSIISTLASGARRRSSALRAASTFFADLNRELDQQVKAIERRVDEGGNLTKAQELEIKLADKLEAASAKLTKTQLAGLQVKAREVVAAQERADAQALELKAATQVANERAALRAAEEKGIADFIAKEEAAREKAVTSVKDRVTALRDEEAAVAKARDLSVSLAEAVELVAIARTEEAASASRNAAPISRWVRLLSAAFRRSPTTRPSAFTDTLGLPIHANSFTTRL